jgi:hypothetical protein
MFTTVEIGGTEYEVEYEVEGASGDGWHEPHHPACVHVTGSTPDFDDLNLQRAIESKIETELGI